MTLEELKAEAKKQGYYLLRKPDYDCSCYMPYPNKCCRRGNGNWICVDKYVNIPSKGKTKCRKKNEINNAI